MPDNFNSIPANATVFPRTSANRDGLGYDFNLYPIAQIPALMQVLKRNRTEIESTSSQYPPLLKEIEDNLYVARYVVDTSQNVWFAREGWPKRGVPAHFQMTENNNCLAAGNIIFHQVGDGVPEVIYISNKSGDFHPDATSMVWLLATLTNSNETTFQLADQLYVEEQNASGGIEHITPYNSYQLRQQLTSNDPSLNTQSQSIKECPGIQPQRGSRFQNAPPKRRRGGPLFGESPAASPTSSAASASPDNVFVNTTPYASPLSTVMRNTTTRATRQGFFDETSRDSSVPDLIIGSLDFGKMDQDKRSPLGSPVH